MAVRTSTYFENALLNTLRATAFSVTIVYVSLHTADPGQTGASEVAGGGYARQALTLGAAAGGSAASTASLAWSVPASTTVAYVGLWDAVTAGNYLDGGALSASVAFVAAGTLTVGSGNLTIVANTL